MVRGVEFIKDGNRHYRIVHCTPDLQTDCYGEILCQYLIHGAMSFDRRFPEP